MKTLSVKVVEIVINLKCIMKKQLNNLNKYRGSHPLTIKGFFAYSSNKLNVIEKKFDWKNALIDATITSLITFFSTLGAGHAAGLGATDGILTATIAAFTQFFVFLALKRGIVIPKES